MEKTGENLSKKTKKLRKITKLRIKNIALYYLQRFDSSVDNLRTVLSRRVSEYAYYNPEFDKKLAENWIEELLEDFERLGYLNDKRYAEFKIKSYLASGKPERYIKIKLQQKGVATSIIDEILHNEEFDSKSMAINHAKKKKIGPYRKTEEDRKQYKQKDLASLVRAGFDYEIAIEVIEMDLSDVVT